MPTKPCGDWSTITGAYDEQEDRILATVAERLSTARRSRLVGREAERGLFGQALAAPELPFLLLHIVGPGGVGKTTLLHAFRNDCAAVGVATVYLDARNFESSPAGFLTALRGVLELPEGANVFDSFADGHRRVLLLDTFETIDGLDRWLREVFLPRLSADTLVVFAGRNPLPAEWRSDPGWQPLLRTVALRNLNPDESREYLTRRLVPEALHRAALDFTHGHPLALSLLVDVLTENALGETARPLTFTPEEAPDVVQALLDRFVADIPSPRHRTALELCALVRCTTEALLEEALGVFVAEEGEPVAPDAYGLFQWLRSLSFIESGPQGVFPHDVVREALLADLRWRNRDRYVDLHRRAREFYSARLREARGAEQQRLMYDCIFLHRDSGVIRAAFTWQETGSVYPDTFKPEDIAALTAIVQRHEGDESVRIATHWFERQPEATVVFRDLAEGGAIVGFFTLLILEPDMPEATVGGGDPAAAASLGFLRASAPLRPGETASYLRYWMARDTYQDPSAVQSLLIVHALRQFLTRARIAYTFFSCADPHLWEPVFEYVDIGRVETAGFTVDGRAFGVYGHDWRAVPASLWLAGLSEREVSGDTGSATTVTPPKREEQTIVLSEPDFASAIKDALRGYVGADTLRTNPLLRSRLVLARASSNSDIAARAETLRRLLKETAEGLQAAPRQARAYRALYHTYFQPAPTQEKAADLLDLPFNTYRRHLSEGITAVSDQLWRMEIGEMV